MLRLRSAAYRAAFVLITGCFLIFLSPLLLAPRSWSMSALKLHAKTLLWAQWLICGSHMVVRGLEKLPPGPVLVAAKHQSAWDTFALIPLMRDPAVVLKHELLSIPLYGLFCRKMEMIPIRRETGPSALRAMLRDAKARAAQGREIVIFPEGTRRTPGAAPRYRPGVVMLYEALGLPCAPIALNSGLYWPRNSRLRYPGPIIVEILDPIPPGVPKAEFLKLLEERIETASQALMEEALASPNPPPKPTEAALKSDF
jgi:1-acyl-sn-glycerol-3-phosphate acyltransferase